MPINFTELVDRVEARNQQNRAQLVAQVKPFLDVIARKSLYEQEKTRERTETAEGLKAIGQTAGVDFQPLTGSDGKLLPSNIQQMQYGAQADRQAPLKQIEAFSAVYGVEMPENIDKMSPEQATATLGKMKEDHAVSETINDMFAAYPDMAEKLLSDPKYQAANLRTKKIMVQKELAAIDAQSNLESFIAKKRIESGIKINEYWSTTGSMQTKKMEADAAGQADLAVGQQKSANIVKDYETRGKSVGGYNVKIDRSKGYKEATMLYKGEKIRKTNAGYAYWDEKSEKWRDLEVDPKDKTSLTKKTGGRLVKNPIYPNAAKILDSALDEYDNNLANTGAQRQQAQPAAQQAQTYDEFNDLF